MLLLLLDKDMLHWLNLNDDDITFLIMFWAQQNIWTYKKKLLAS